MYCPKCGIPFRKGPVRCIGCDVDLVEGWPPVELMEKRSERPEYLFTRQGRRAKWFYWIAAFVLIGAAALLVMRRWKKVL